MMHYFFPVSDFPPIFPKNVSDSFFQFSNHFSHFNPPKFLQMTFHLVIHYKFLIPSPIFAVSVNFPPIWGKLLFPLLLQISYPWFRKIYVFLHTLCVYRFPLSLAMTHLCITQCTYWTPLLLEIWYHQSSNRFWITREVQIQTTSIVQKNKQINSESLALPE